MPFYAVTLKGLCAGQEVINVLWYRNPSIFSTLADLLGAEAAMAAEVKENIWDDADPVTGTGASLRDIMPETYTLQAIEVSSHQDNGLLGQTDPHVLVVGETGLLNEPSNGPAPYFLFKANLEGALGPGIGLPTRGHLKIGPSSDVMVDDSGHLHPSWETPFAIVAARFAANIVTELPVQVYFPIRVRVTRILGVISAIGYKDVDSFSVDPLARFLRSRVPEA